MFDIVQPCSTNVQPILSRWRCLWPKMAFLAKYGPFWGLWGPLAPFFGGPKGPNSSPWMCLTMSNLVQPMSNPFGAVRGAYGQKWPFWQNMALFWGLWGPPAPFFGGPKGPNRSPWMCLTMSNLVQPLSNPFEAARGAYVRKWP